MTHYRVSARKYRPKNFSEVIGQEAIVTTLKNALKRNSVSHAYLFSGSRGCGKTTLARILAKALSCQNPTSDFEPCSQCSSCKEIAEGSSIDVLEIDGASHRGIDDIKEIADSAGYMPAKSPYKIYIIDEVHMLTKEAFNALLKTLEEPPENVKFFFATTEAHKVPETIVSRCQRFMLKRIALEKIVEKLSFIAKESNVSVDEKTLYRLARFAEGGLRDAESLFDQMISYSDGTIVDTTVEEVLGLMPQELFISLDEAVKKSDIAFAYKLVDRLFADGKELTHFLSDLTAHYKGILFSKLESSDLLVSFDSAYKETLLETSRGYTKEELLTILDMIMQTQETIKHAISPKIALEHLLTKIIRVKLRIPIEYLVQRLSEIEKSLDSKIAPNEAIEPVTKATVASVEKKKPIEKITIAPQKKEPVKRPAGPSDEDAKEQAKQQVRYDTLMQFAKVELDGILVKE